MDLNRLFFQHQIALMRANAAPSRPERERHNAEADGIASRISGIHLRNGTRALPLMPAAAL